VEQDGRRPVPRLVPGQRDVAGLHRDLGHAREV
jgi:hypothetical protein